MRFPFRPLPDQVRFDFLGKRWWGFGVSLLLTLLAMFMLMTKGLNFGIDFTGGVLMEVRTEQAADLNHMREILSQQGFGEVSLQDIGTDRDVMIRVQAKEDADQQEVVAKVKEVLGTGYDYRRIDYVGPTVGSELARNATIAVILATLSIMVYIGFRFEWQFGVGTVAALLHDAVMLVGFYAVTQFEFGLNAIAAILTILGYSVNDTVVIYDRIRENLRKYRKMPLEELLNLSMSETFARTVMTSTSVLLASTALAIWGGEVLRGFSLALVFGVLIGTFSSIFISSPMLIYLGLRADAKGTVPNAG